MKVKRLEKSKIFLLNIKVLILCVITSLVMYFSYSGVMNKFINEFRDTNGLSNYNFVQDLYDTSIYLYSGLLIQKEHSANPNDDFKSPGDVLINNDIEYDDLEGYKEELTNSVLWSEQYLSNSLINLEYYAIDNEGNNTRRCNAQLEGLIDSSNGEVLEDLDKFYQAYVVMEYDENGNMTIKNIKDVDEDEFYKNMNLLNNNRKRAWEQGEITSTKPITNMTFVYGIPKDLVSSDVVSMYFDYNYSRSLNILFIVFMGAVLFITLSALIMSYKKTKSLIGLKFIKEIPFEVIVFVGWVIIFILMWVGVWLVNDNFDETIKNYLLNFTNNEWVSNYIVIFINIAYWCLCFYLLFLAITLTKHIWKSGIRRYIKEKTLAYKIYKPIKKCTLKLKDIDIREKNTKKLIIIMGINAIILSIMSMFWFFGVFGIIIYSIIIFNLAKKYMDDINIKYNKLLKSTNAIADGDLSVEINDDLGILNPLKEQVEKIQKGFKKAVEKEVKSEKMKTELISNVSHDLKTPLTSIITYIDLLKDDTLSEEKKKQYLDTLDRKSQSLQYLIEDLFEISKVNSKNISLNLSDVDLVYLMKQTLLELDYKIKETNLKIKTTYNKNNIICKLDGQRTFRIFENLITNITKYSLEGSRVYIDIFENDESIKITLKNIAKEEMDFNSKDIIERFARGDKSRNAEGAGLGLAIAKSFVEVQGGTFNVVLDGDLFKVIIKFNK